MWGKELLPKISQIYETSIYRVIRLCRDAIGKMPVYCKWHWADCQKKKQLKQKIFKNICYAHKKHLVAYLT